MMLEGCEKVRGRWGGPEEAVEDSRGCGGGCSGVKV